MAKTIGKVIILIKYDGTNIKLRQVHEVVDASGASSYVYGSATTDLTAAQQAAAKNLAKALRDKCAQ